MLTVTQRRPSITKFLEVRFGASTQHEDVETRGHHETKGDADELYRPPMWALGLML